LLEVKPGLITCSPREGRIYSPKFTTMLYYTLDMTRLLYPMQYPLVM